MSYVKSMLIIGGLAFATYGCKKRDEMPAAPTGTEEQAATATTERTGEEVKQEPATEEPKPAVKEPAAAATGGSIGIPECDEYITKYEKCLDEKVPEASRAPMKDAFAKTREGWKKMADNAATKPSLAQACKQAMEAAKTSMKAMGCAF